MNGVLSTLDWVIVALYLVFSLLIGIIFSKRAGKSTKEYFISGRNLPWWIAGTSMVATSFAVDTPLVVTGWIRKAGVSENWIWWSFAVGGMFSVFLLSRLWRRAEVITDVELTELRYSGKSAAALRGFRALYFAIPINCITLTWVVLAMIKCSKVFFGIRPEVAVLFIIALTTAYCVLSGYWGVVVTDLMQFALAMTGAIALAVVAVRNIGGLGELQAQAALASGLRERLLHFFPRPPEGASPLGLDFWKGPLFAFVAYISIQWWANKNADGGGVIIQRMSSTKNERHSLLATLWFNIANYAVRPWPWIIVALASMVVLPTIEDPELAYPQMIKVLAGPGLMGVIIASLIGAFMSTVDTHFNLSSAYIVNDFYRRFVKRRASERHYVLVSRISAIFLMIVSSWVALQSESISGLFKFLVAFSSGVGLVYILRWFWWRINAWSEISAMSASSLICSFLNVFNKELQLSYPAILCITVAGSTLVWLAVTFLTKPVDEEKLLAFYRKVRPYGAWGKIAEKAGVAPARGLAGLITNWLAGTVMVLGATLSAGKFLLGSSLEGWCYLAAAAIGAAVISREVFRGRGKRTT